LERSSVTVNARWRRAPRPWSLRRKPAIGAPVKPFIDLVGASGAVYRFRAVQDARELPASAGNFVCVRADGASDQVVCCGTARSLARAAEAWRTAAENGQTPDLYIRLNVSRSQREAEHQDLVAVLAAALVVSDVD
jgi:hypothetical protein